ncbi:8-amino-7-oxononanoate synthase [Thiotrichales bacterium 19S9-12]|nr:8-amino-7-oxononanoate synthase [Thiotrichales bacterium 19S9-11]MCF6812131.1 8-amino-7-oxononanoate synthase [Thiotrichales bacterium 19S9-12]
MSTLIDQYAKRLECYQNKGLLREPIEFEARKDNLFKVNQSDVINFSSNDYLGLTTDKRIKEALKESIDIYGFGSGSSVVVSGYSGQQKKLEVEFAQFVNRERAIFLNNGYMANLAVISTLFNRHHTIASDKLIHASILDGIQLSRAKHKRYRHLDISHLSNILDKETIEAVITESIFSMEGDLAPLGQISILTKKQNSLLIVDDAHGAGILGNSSLEYFNLNQQEVDILVTPLGKAFAGTGAFVSGSAALIDTIRQFARSYHYTTALPPFIAQGLLKVLEIIKSETWRRVKLQELIGHFIEKSNQLGLSLVSNELTPIKSIVIGSNHKVTEIKQKLLDQGYLVSAIRPPTVPENTARIRISINSIHTRNEIDSLLSLLANLVAR